MKYKVTRAHFPLKASVIALAVASALPCRMAQAFEFDTGDSDVKVTWDNSVKYSVVDRLLGTDPALLGGGSPYGLDLDDGDNNFQKKGIVSNRVDWLSALDIGTKSTGVRLSAEAWYDSVYNKSNNNNSAGTNAAVLNGTATDQFTTGTRNEMGRDSRLMDAFVFTKGDLGDMPFNARLGQHTVIYGETLFFGGNGIAAAQGPIDIARVSAVPNSEPKDFMLPVPQISGNLQINKDVSVGAYYQFEWRPDVFPAVGSYLSTFDVIGAGATAYLNAPTYVPSSTAPIFYNIPALKARNSGQFGFQLKYTPQGSDVQYGFYAAQYNDKAPNFYIGFSPASPAPSTWQSVYAQGIKTYGVSATTVLGPANVAIEASVRRNADLNSDPQLNVGSSNNSGNPGYAVGNTAHINLSVIDVLTANSLFQGGSIVAELGWNRTTSITANPGAVDPNTTRDATALRAIFEADYYQVLPGLDIGIPVGLGYNLDGRSSAMVGFGDDVYHGGDFNIGVKGTYQTVWKFGLTYMHYFGTAGGWLKNNPATNTPEESYYQPLADRDYIAFNLERSF